MTFARAVLPILFLGILILIPSYAEAANASFFGPIIQEGCHCEGSAPDWGCVLDAIHNVFNLIFSLSVLVFALTAAYSGILFMTSVTNAENKSKAKSMLLNTVVGLAIALSAWLMVDFVMRVLYNENAGWGPWNRILAVDSARRCLAPQEPPQQNTGGGEDGPEVVGEGDVSEGDRVECNRGSGGEYEPGEITAVTTGEDGAVRVSVEYDDGQTEQNIPADRCRPSTGGGVDLSDINVTQGSNVIVSNAAKEALKRILQEAGLTSAHITSGRRTAEDQARVMYQNLESYGVAHQKRLYGAAGDQVIDIYTASKAAGKSETQIRADMLAKINQLGCLTVSRHCSTRDVIDVDPGSISNRSSFEAAVRDSSAVSNHIFPPDDPAYHLEF